MRAASPNSPVSIRVLGASRTTGALVLLLGLLVSGCGSIPLPARGLHGSDPKPMVAIKLVVAKEEPAALIAEDGTRCLVSRSRFERTRVGSEIFCVWTGDGGHLRR